MSENPFKTKEFKKLFEEWNNRLEEEGFADAEDFSQNCDRLKTWHSFKFVLGTAPLRASECAEYFDRAQQLLHNGFIFENELALRIWQLHCIGYSIRKISEIIEQTMLNYTGTRRNNVHYIIKKIQKAGNIK
jgi:hypothetical protein